MANGEVLAYIRVSTNHQETARQRDLLDGADKVFEEKVSATSLEREQLNALFAYAREGDLVRVASVDRLARSISDLTRLVTAFTDKGVTVEFIKERLTLQPVAEGESDPMQTLMLNMFAVIAQFEREIMLSRQREARAARIARGLPAGKAKRFSSKQVKAIKEKAAAGVPIARIARDYQASWHTIKAALRPDYLENK